MDLQQSSAPLLRQLESTERQNRLRATAWAELEAKLREEIHELSTERRIFENNEKELEAELKKIRRTLQGKESELIISSSRIEAISKELEETRNCNEIASSEVESLKLELSSLEASIENNENKARSEMLKTLRENEERFNDHIDSLEVELRQEKDKRMALEQKIQDMAFRADNILLASGSNKQNYEKTPKRNLGSKASQADILENTLYGLDADDYYKEDNKEDFDQNDERSGRVSMSTDSFAFIEELSQTLKATKMERDTLRKQLNDSEERRNFLENEVVTNGDAVKDLSNLKHQVEKMQRELNEKDFEIEALQEDIIEVRNMYKSQLNALMTEKDSSIPPSTDKNSSIKSSKLGTAADAKIIPANQKPVLPTSFTGMRTF